MPHDTEKATDTPAAKVAAVTLGFWIAKVAATTLGETGGDWVSMSLHLGYLVGTAIFAAIFVVLVHAQVRASRFHPLLYWATIVATTTLGTTMADFFDRSIGVGYPGYNRSGAARHSPSCGSRKCPEPDTWARFFMPVSTGRQASEMPDVCCLDRWPPFSPLQR